jgi:CubicO group peptidase (beta-lactamase class C family)
MNYMRTNRIWVENSASASRPFFRGHTGKNLRSYAENLWLSSQSFVLLEGMKRKKPQSHPRIQNIVTRAIIEGVFPGCVVGIVSPTGERAVHPFGRFTYERHSPVVEGDTIFDVASITKSVPTASLALQLADEGVLDIDEKLLRYIPEISHSYKEKIRVHHLLTHTLHFSFSLSSLKERTPEEILGAIYHEELLSPPGSRFFYSNATSVLLCIVVERVADRPLDALAQSRFFGPLLMHRSSFSPKAIAAPHEIVPTEFDPWRNRVIQGEVHDESAYTLSRDMTPGSAGLFSTVPDLLTFCEMLLRGGTLRGKKYLSNRMVKRISTNHLAGINETTGLGWELNQPRFMGPGCSSRAFGKTGFTGCSVVCDPEKHLGVVILSNWTYPRRKQEKTQIDSVRASIADTVYRWGI